MKDITLGFWCIHDRPLHDAEAAQAVARILTDSRWPWMPCLVSPMSRPGHPSYPWKAGRIAAAALRETVANILISPRTFGAMLHLSKKGTLDHAWYQVDSGQRRPGDVDYKFPFRAIAMCRGSDLPPGASAAAWIELMHELVVVARAPHAMIWAGADWRPIASRQYLTGVPRPEYPPDHVTYEIERVQRHRNVLGDRYIRPPAWGTCLNAAHVDALGGRDKIVDTVRPDVVREVGELEYFQLSERVEDAVTEVTERKRRAFEELALPITVPRS